MLCVQFSTYLHTFDKQLPQSDYTNTRTLFDPQLPTIILGLSLSLSTLYASKRLWKLRLKSYSSASS